jgi:hypothetical protein
VRTITLDYGGGYRIRCDILSLQYDGENKINTSKMNLLQSYIKRELKSDLNLCSIDNEDIVISNRNKFEYELPNKNILLGGDYSLYEKSISKYSYTSPKDEISRLTGYKLKIY